MKKLSFILSVIFILSVCILPVSSFADSQTNVVSSELASDFLDAMGITNPISSKTNEQLITRAEALGVITALFGYEGSSSAVVPFTDVKEELTGSLRYALDLKLISEADTFRPNEPITYNEAFKMCAVGLGYDYLAKVYGGWSAGYVRVAKDCGLSDGLPVSENTITASAFSLFVENLLVADMLEVEGMVYGEIEYSKYTTVLEIYFNMYEVEGVVTANQFTGIYSSDDATDDGEIAIDDVIYKCTDTSNYIGRNVKAYVDISSNKIAAIAPYENKNIKVAFSDMISFDAPVFKYDEQGSDKKIKTDDVVAVIYNGKTEDKFKIADFNGKQGYFNFIDNDSDNVYEICEVFEYKTIVVSGVNVIEEYIADKNGEKKLDLSDDECVYYVYSSGKEISLSELAVGSLITYYQSTDGKVCYIYVESNTTKGTLTGFQKDAIVIDDVSYSYSEYFKKYYLSKLKSGQEITVILSSSGVIEASSEPEKDNILFGYYIDVKTTSGLDTSLIVKLVLNDGKIATVNVNDKFTFNGTKLSSSDKIYSVFFDSNGSKKLEEQVVRYKLTSDGKLSLIDTVTDTEGYISTNDNFEDNLKKYVYPVGADLVHDAIWIEPSTNIIHPWYALNTETFFIQVNPDKNVAEERRFVVRDLNWMRNLKSFTRSKVDVYNVDEFTVAGALVFNTEASNTITDNAKMGVVHSVTRALNADLMEAYKLVIYSGGYYNEYYISDEDVIKKYLLDDSGNVKIASGDCIRLEADSQNNISVLSLDYDESEKTLLYKNTNQMYTCYYYGGVYSMGNGYMTMLREAPDGSGLDIGHQLYSFKAPSSVMVYDSKTGEVTEGSPEEFETYLQVADECTRVMIVTDDLEMRMCIVYK